MTLPDERARAVILTEQFLLDLCNPKETPRVPKEVRARASSLLRHYPSKYEMELVGEREDKREDNLYPKIFTADFYGRQNY